ncbi:uncharacterized protein LOC127059421 [Serinus canaria]|uniref:uncharacterized protein LOC127059421 n=1 Tax=Serinus canaria TaxID=9135 RepID=UPI0021CC881D|nr:uncharacterized protein LOC127059421 [Serinus canaria]
MEATVALRTSGPPVGCTIPGYNTLNVWDSDFTESGYPQDGRKRATKNGVLDGKSMQIPVITSRSQRLSSKELPDSSSPVPTNSIRIIKRSIKLTLNGWLLGVCLEHGSLISVSSKRSSSALKLCLVSNFEQEVPLQELTSVVLLVSNYLIALLIKSVILCIIPVSEEPCSEPAGEGLIPSPAQPAAAFSLAHSPHVPRAACGGCHPLCPFPGSQRSRARPTPGRFPAPEAGGLQGCVCCDSAACGHRGASLPPWAAATRPRGHRSPLLCLPALS